MAMRKLMECVLVALFASSLACSDDVRVEPMRDGDAGSQPDADATSSGGDADAGGASQEDGSADADGSQPPSDTDTDADASPPLDHPVCEADEGNCFYIAPNAGSGTGSWDDPFGVDDLPDPGTSSCQLASAAFEALDAGDILYFRGGDYEFGTCAGDHWRTGYVRPARSGTAQRPITFAAYPGEDVRLRRLDGGQPALGNAGHDFIRYVGFVVEPGPAAGIYVMGRGVEVAYNEFVGQHVAIMDNHDGVRLENARDGWIHHNIIHGVTGEHVNSAGIKVYTSQDLLIEDNYIHSNTSGVYDKDSSQRITYRRNYITGNTTEQWYGNNQGQPALAYIYDNVIDGPIELHSLTENAEIHDNLVRADKLTGAWAGETWNTGLWNNIVVTQEASVVAYSESKHPFDNSGDPRHLSYMDHNFYTAPPSYSFGRYSDTPSTFSLEEMRQMGFETQTQVLDVSELFVDETGYVLQPQWQDAGRNASRPGPDDIAQILDETRYGPDARP